MLNHAMSRRGFLKSSVVAGAVLAGGMGSLSSAFGKESGLHIATNQYPWLVFYGRENRDFNASLDAGLGEVAASGMMGYEPLANSSADIDRLGDLVEMIADAARYQGRQPALTRSAIDNACGQYFT